MGKSKTRKPRLEISSKSQISAKVELGEASKIHLHDETNSVVITGLKDIRRLHDFLEDAIAYLEGS